MDLYIDIKSNVNWFPILLKFSAFLINTFLVFSVQDKSCPTTV